YVIIIFDLYWLFRVISISVYLILGYSKVQKTAEINWLELCEKSAQLKPSLKKIDSRLAILEKEHSFHPDQKGPFHMGTKKYPSIKYRELINQKKELLKLK